MARQKKLATAGIWEQKLTLAAQAAVYLERRVKGVLAVGLTGSAAYGDVDEADDLDFLIITRVKRVYTTRLWCYWRAMIKGKLRRAGREKDSWCLNLFLAADGLVIPKAKRDRFAALQLVRLKILRDEFGLFSQLWQENLFWLKEFLTEGELKKCSWQVEVTQKPKVSQGSRLGDVGEEICRRGQLLYMQHKRTREVLNRRQIFFHPRQRK
jgi:hypothetical protein